MIQYDPHNWSEHLLDVRGSMIREILGRVSMCVVWSAVITVTYEQVPALRPYLAMSETAHTLVGVALGLLLVFRTNASYDRFWEGRKLWGGIVNETRNLMRQASVWLPTDPHRVERINYWAMAWPFSSMDLLRGTPRTGRLRTRLGAEDFETVARENHVPLAIARRITGEILVAHQQKQINDLQLTALDHNVQLLIDYLGGCERIRSTPLPFAYTVHLRRALFMYCFTLPFALVHKFDWGAIPATFLLAYTLFGIEEIGVEIEDPFGIDDNDLPLEAICEKIAENLQSIPLESSPVTRS